MRRLLPLLLLLTVLIGCLTGGVPPTTYPTLEEAVTAGRPARVRLAHLEPYGADRQLALVSLHGGPIRAGLFRQTAGGWQVDRWGGGELAYTHALSSLTYGGSSLGRKEALQDGVRCISAESYLLYGELLDPLITWVEVIQDEPQAEPVQAQVADGIWLLHLPTSALGQGFTLKAGNQEGLRFQASINQSPFGDLMTGPDLTFMSSQAGLRLSYPAVIRLHFDGERNLELQAANWRMVIERRPKLGLSHEERLAWHLTNLPVEGPSQVQILEQGASFVADRPASYLLEARGKPTQIYVTARYFINTSQADWQVRCEMTNSTTLEDWQAYHQPECQRVLGRLQLDP